MSDTYPSIYPGHRVELVRIEGSPVEGPVIGVRVVASPQDTVRSAALDVHQAMRLGADLMLWAIGRENAQPGGPSWFHREVAELVRHAEGVAELATTHAAQAQDAGARGGVLLDGEVRLQVNGDDRIIALGRGGECAHGVRLGAVCSDCVSVTQQPDRWTPPARGARGPLVCAHDVPVGGDCPQCTAVAPGRGRE